MLADRPLAVMYAKDVNESSVLNYVQGMLRRLRIGKTIYGHISQQLAKTIGTKAQTPVVGQLIYSRAVTCPVVGTHLVSIRRGRMMRHRL